MDVVTVLHTALMAVAPGINLTSSSMAPIDPRLLMTTDDICRSNGYQCEVHSLTTKDGYELTMHRVLPAAPFRAAILLMSGLAGCSDNFFLLGKKNSLPFMLADAGYDVFLGNQRGCTYSRRHKKWTRKDTQYWRFSLDDVAQFDLPPLMALAQRLSAERGLFYVGFSAGGHALYGLLALRPDLRDSLRAAFLMAPAVLFTRRHSPYMRAISTTPDRAIRLVVERADEWLGRPPGSVRLVWQACGRAAARRLRGACRAVTSQLLNLDASKVDIENLDFILTHSFCGTSTVAAAHFAQMIKSKKLQRFDWGYEENLRRYGSEKPPEYLLQNITLPIASFVSRGDRYVAVEDAQLLAQKSSRNLGVFVMPQENWDHFDFLANQRAPRQIYDRILGMLAGL